MTTESLVEGFGLILTGIELVPFNDVDALEDLFIKKSGKNMSGGRTNSRGKLE